MVTCWVAMSVQLFTKITGNVSEYFSFTEETILHLKTSRKLGFFITKRLVFHKSVNAITRSVSPLRIIYGVVSNPCVSIYIIHGRDAFAKLKTLVSPTPLNDVALSDIVTTMTQHYKKDTVEIAERRIQVLQAGPTGESQLQIT